MSLCVAVVSRDYVVLGSESREIEYLSPSSKEWTIKNDTTPKTFLLDNRIGLNYSGISGLKHWSRDDEIRKLHELARKGANIYDLAGLFKENLDRTFAVLPQNAIRYNFIFATCMDKNGNATYPKVVVCNSGKPIEYYGHVDKNRFINCVYHCGVDTILERFMNTEEFNYDMEVNQAVDFVRTMLTIACKSLQFFTGRPETAGGPINVLVVSPGNCGWVESADGFYAYEKQIDRLKALYMKAIKLIDDQQVIIGKQSKELEMYRRVANPT